MLGYEENEFFKQIEQALEASQEWVQLLADNISDLVTLMDLRGIRRFVSPSHTQILGYGPAELVGKPMTSIILAEDINQVNVALVRLARTGKFEKVEFRIRHADGHHLWHEGIGKLISSREGNPLGLVITSRDINERKRAEETIQRQLQRLSALRAVDVAITGSLDLNVTLGMVLDQVTTQLRIDAADILLYDSYLQTLEFATKRGFHSNALEKTRLRLGQGYAGLAALERRLIHVPELQDTQTGLAISLERAGERFTSLFAVPLIARGEVRGVLEMFHRTPLDPDREWLDFLETLANQAAIAIDNVSLFEALQRSNMQLALAYDLTLEGWSRALDLRDKETEGHTLRVTEMTLRLAQELGIQGDELVHIRRGALLHDIGKIGVSDRILLKEGPLAEDEWAILRQHPVYAYELLGPIEFLRSSLDIPYFHHEKWDGSGYPHGLKGEQIPLAARIFAVVDVWDALRSDRPYRQAWTKERVREYLKAQSDRDFDPGVVEAFVKLWDGGRIDGQTPDNRRSYSWKQ